MSSQAFDEAAVSALKAIGKTLGQMSLYRVGHPAVAESVGAALAVLRAGLDQSPTGDLSYSLDGDKIVANGRVVGAKAQLPNAVIGMFTRFKLNSMIFKNGITDAELLALCEMAAMRPEQAAGLDVKSFLAERSVSHISLNEAIYAKVDKAPAETPLRETSLEAPHAPAEDLSKKIEDQSLDQTLETLIRAATKNPDEQAKVSELIRQRLKDELESKVREATAALRRDKTVLENEQLRTQSVLTNMAEGVVVVDDQGKVLMMNPAAEDLYGVKLVEAAGKPLVDHAKDEHLLAMASELTVPNDKPIQGTVEVKAKDDARKTLRASAAVVQTESGKTVGMVSVLSDVAKQREFDRMEREFVAHVTHELRAPLSSIRAALELIQGQLVGKLPSEDEKMFLMALKNTDRLDDLIRSILDFSKIESGQMTVHPQPSSAEKIVREGVESLRPWAVKKNIQLSLNIDPALPPVNADPPRIVQVLVNLLSNAIKFTPGGGHILVRAANGSGSRDKFIIVSVKDSGPGIPKSEHGKIFEKFVQIAAGEKHVGGTGLGLAIAKALVHLHKGTLWVESEPGRGAEFVFTLPHYVAPRDTSAPVPVKTKSSWWRRLMGQGR